MSCVAAAEETEPPVLSHAAAGLGSQKVIVRCEHVLARAERGELIGEQ